MEHLQELWPALDAMKSPPPPALAAALQTTSDAANFVLVLSVEGAAQGSSILVEYWASRSWSLFSSTQRLWLDAALDGKGEDGAEDHRGTTVLVPSKGCDGLTLRCSYADANKRRTGDWSERLQVEAPLVRVVLHIRGGESSVNGSSGSSSCSIGIGGGSVRLQLMPTARRSSSPRTAAVSRPPTAGASSGSSTTARCAA